MKSFWLLIFSLLFFKSIYSADETKTLKMSVYCGAYEVIEISISPSEKIRNIINRIRDFGFDTVSLIINKDKKNRELDPEQTADEAGLWNMDENSKAAAFSEKKIFYCRNGDSILELPVIYRNTTMSDLFKNIKEKLKLNYYDELKLMLNEKEVKLYPGDFETKVKDIEGLWEKAEITLVVNYFKDESWD